eukprot:434273-Rhodomonas_salina.2
MATVTQGSFESLLDQEEDAAGGPCGESEPTAPPHVDHQEAGRLREPSGSSGPLADSLSREPLAKALSREPMPQPNSSSPPPEKQATDLADAPSVPELGHGAENEQDSSNLPGVRCRARPV